MHNINFTSDSHLAQQLREHGLAELAESGTVQVPKHVFTHFVGAIARDYAHLQEFEHEALAVICCLTHPNHRAQPEPQAPGTAPERVIEPQTMVDLTPWAKRIFWALIALILVTLLAPHLHAQKGTSRIDVITIQDSGGSKVATFAAPFAIKCGTNISCTKSGGVITFAASGSLGVSFDQITSQTNTAALVIGNGGSLEWTGTGYINARKVNGVSFTNGESLGKIPIGQGDGTAVWSDPLVQGLYAAGTTTLPNPVVFGGHDYSGTPTIRTLKVDASGNLYAVITFAAPQHVIVDSSSSLAVTGTFWQAKQPVSLTDGDDPTLGAKADNKSAATDTTPVTLISLMKELSYLLQNALAVTGPLTDTQLRATAVPVSGTVTASGPVTDTQLRATPVPVSGTVTASGPVTDTQLRATPVPVSGTVTTTPPSNASSNVAQINGATPLMGAGNTGAGSQRVTIATDQAALPAQGHGATGAAVPAGAQYIGGNGTGNLTGYLACDGYAFYDASTNGATELVALTSGKIVYVCGYSITSSATTANTVKLVYGTGTACATGQNAMTPGYVVQAPSGAGPAGKVVPPTGMVSGLKTAASNALCVLTNAAQAAQVEVWYTKF